MKRGTMDDGPCLQAARELEEATNEELLAQENLKRVLASKPTGGGHQVQRWQRTLAKARRREIASAEAKKAKSDALEKCKEAA
jgi:hypothetical protein